MRQIGLGSAVCLAAALVLWALPASAGEQYWCLGERATIVGSNRGDRLRGTEGRDVIVGRGGLDRIRGLGGNDVICGNGFYIGAHDSHGADYLYGGAGDDRISGGKGDDANFGGRGDDVIFANEGAEYLSYGDALIGGPGDDRLVGGDLGELFIPGPGRDVIVAKASYRGSDSVHYTGASRGVHVDLARGMARGQGRDRLGNVENATGSEFGDVLIGSYERNALGGSGGDDVLRARSGNDSLDGGAGLDKAYGGSGRDYCEAEIRDSCM